MNRGFLVLFLLLSLPFQSGYSQLFGLPHQERYTVSNGLSNNSITDIAQDQLGFLWIGTADGLNRYDGFSFRVYHPSPEDSASISDSFISTLTSDQDGKLWIGTQKGGINSYNFNYDSFDRAGISDFSNRQTDFFVSHGNSLLVEESNVIWVGTGQGLVKIPLVDQLEFILSDMAVNSLYKDNHDIIWVGSSNGLYFVSASHQTIVAADGLPADKTGTVLAIIEDQLGNLLIGGKNGLFVRKNDIWEEIKTIRGGREISFSNINALSTDKHNRIWIAGQEGLEVIEAGTYQVKENEIDVLHRNNLDKENIQSLFLDKEENLWIGTANNGLIRLFLSDEHFPLYRQNLNVNTGGTTGNTIRSIWANQNDEIWLGSYGAGLFKFDRKEFSFMNYRADASASHSISGNQVSAIYQDSTGNFWVGTWGDGLNKVIRKGRQLSFESQEVVLRKKSDQSRVSEIHWIFEDEFQNLWVVANEALIKKNKGSDTFVDVTHYFDLPYLDLNAVLEDHQGNWWVGTWNGLFVFNKEVVQNAKKDEPGTFRDPRQSFSSDRKDRSMLTNNRITYLFQDRRQRIWVGTYGGGLNLWIPGNSNQPVRTGYFKSFTRENGLPNNVIYGILEDEVGRLWLSTNNGLVMFDPDEETFQTFTSDDGLQSNQFYFGAFTKMPSGEFIFGGNNGFNIINPLLFSQENIAPPNVLITDFTIRGEKVPIGKREDGSTVMNQSIMTSDFILLQPFDNNFRFEFLSPSFNQVSKMKYAYRMVGLNDQWSYANSQERYAVYSNLFEKNYTFEIKASIDGKNWSATRQISIRVLPPWYRTWWAYSLFTILVLLFIGSIARISYVYSTLRNKLKLEKISRQKETEINEMRMWFFTYISHEFRTPLTLIISPLLELINDSRQERSVRNKLKTVYRNSQRLQRMVNQILNFRMINSGKPEIKVMEHDIVSFTKKVGESFVDHAQERSIQYEFYSDKSDISLWFDGEKMELIIYNLLSNAFKYSSDGQKVNLQIKDRAHSVEIEVKDRGIGIPQEKLDQIFEPFQRVENNQAIGSGIGLALVKELIELHQGKIEVKSEKDKGSTFTISIQKGKKHFEPEQISLGPLKSPTSTKSITTNLIQSSIPQSESKPLFSDLENKEKPQLLIVEDNTDLRKYLKSHFEKDFIIREAGNGKKGLELTEKYTPDLIISDVMMPVMDGLAMIKHIKENSQTSHIPIILLTAQTAAKKQMKGFEQGAFEYITKPVDMNLLEARVFAILKNLQQIKAHYKHEGILPLHGNHSANEEKFLLKAAKIIEENLTNPQFNAESFASMMGVSRSGLYKKLQSLAGKSTTQFIRFVRLKYAEKLLKEGQSNVSQTAFQVGFSDLKYFRKCFKQEFGVTPSEFLKAAK